MSSGDETLRLFAAPSPVPDGFVYREDFLAADEEQTLIGEIQKLDLAPFQYYRFTGRRRTISFGWQYEFGQKDIAPAPEIPSSFLPLRARSAAVFDIEPSALVHMSILEYPPGAPIGWHRDIPHFGLVVGVSLSSACRMRFRKHQRARSKGKRDEVLSVEIQPRSIYLMTGESRKNWQHSIPPVKELRYAIMMRTLRTGRKEPAAGAARE